MATEVEVASHAVNGINGVKANGKVKSKNQLRRLKAKQKKAEQGNAPVRVLSVGIASLYAECYVGDKWT